MEQNHASARIAAITKHLEQADALGRAGRLKEMEQVCRRLLANFPDCAEAWNRLAIIQAELGNGLQAASCLEKAIAAAPYEPSFHANLGEILRRAGLAEAALTHCRRAIALNAEHVVANLNLAYALLDSNQPEPAALHFQKVLAADSQNLQACFGLGLAQSRNKQTEAAIATFSRYAAYMPNDVRVYVLLTNLRLAIGDFSAAQTSAERAVELQPNLLEAVTALSDVLRQQGKLAETETLLRKYLTTMPDSAPLLYRLALCRLEQGDYRQGFALYESRFNIDASNPIEQPILPMPAWNGEDLRGKRLLVITEQGYGDHFQFFRFMPLLAAQNVELVHSVSPPLFNLMRRQACCASVLVNIADACASACDYWTFLCSLPFRLGIDSVAQIPAPAYLRADEEKRAAWRQRLAQLPQRRKIGLVWAGRPEHQNDRQRSIAFSQLAPLFTLEDVAWISLQKGPRAGEAQILGVTSFDSEIADFDDSAALIAELDLMVSVDTSTAHLAGALGIPVWTLLPKEAEWRWNLAEHSSPWYPSMRLIRQAERGDWSGVIRQVAADLQAG